MKRLTNEQWTEVFEAFFEECREFWVRELTKRGFDEIYVEKKSRQNAFSDVNNTTRFPFVPMGEKVPPKLLFEWALKRGDKLLRGAR